MKTELLNRTARTEQKKTAELTRTHAATPQLELAFSGPPCRSRSARQRRLNRAHWWFQQMRELVDRACDWTPAPNPRPQQTCFPGLHREPLTASREG